MKLKKIQLTNFRSFKNLEIKFHPQLTVIVGINGSGKTTVLDSCAILLSAMISYIKHSSIKYTKDGSGAIELNELDIHNKEGSTKISAYIIEDTVFLDKDKHDALHSENEMFWEIVKIKEGHEKKFESNFKFLKNYSSNIQAKIEESQEQCSLPAIMYFGTNRAILEIPKKIKTKHNFNLLNTYDGSLLGSADFRLFFEWFRNQEDYENELNSNIKEDVKNTRNEIKELKGVIENFENMLQIMNNLPRDILDNSNLNDIHNMKQELYNIKQEISDLNKILPELSSSVKDRNKLTKSLENKQLNAVRKAFVEFIPNIQDIRIRRNGLAMVANKNGIEIEIDQLSDGEKSLLALIGDLARRLTMANPTLGNPLEGHGIVLIDEIELHLHPTWQRDVVPKLITVFPNCQFIITTHSPQVIGEVAVDSLRLLKWNDKEKQPEITTNISRSIGLNSAEILEEIMKSPIRNQNINEKINKIFEFINVDKYDEAGNLIDELEDKYGELPETIRARSYLSVFQ